MQRQEDAVARQRPFQVAQKFTAQPRIAIGRDHTTGTGRRHQQRPDCMTAVLQAIEHPADRSRADGQEVRAPQIFGSEKGLHVGRPAAEMIAFDEQPADGNCPLHDRLRHDCLRPVNPVE